MPEGNPIPPGIVAASSASGRFCLSLGRLCWRRGFDTRCGDCTASPALGLPHAAGGLRGRPAVGGESLTHAAATVLQSGLGWVAVPRLFPGIGSPTRCGRRTYCTGQLRSPYAATRTKAPSLTLAAFGSLLGSSPTAPRHRHTDVHVRVSVLAAVHGGSRGAVTGFFAK